jgi:hypothetical protein
MKPDNTRGITIPADPRLRSFNRALASFTGRA